MSGILMRALAVVSFTTCLALPVSAQETVRIRGTIERIEGPVYVVKSRDGAELFYLAPDFKMYSVRTRDLKVGSLPVSTPLFSACPATQPLYETLGGYPYDVAPDGRFLIICRSGQSNFVVTVNGAVGLRL